MSKITSVMLFAAIVPLILFGFSNILWSGDNQLKPLKKDFIQKYYKYEKQRNWQEAYKYRTPYFKKAVPFETYKRIMKRDSQGWDLVKIEIKDIKMDNDRAFVRIIFYEKPPSSYWSKLFANKGVELQEKTVWRRINNNWYVENPGERDHLTLNVDLIE